MILNTSTVPWSAADDTAVRNDWRRYRIVAVRFAIILSAIAVIGSYAEWFLNSAWPLYQGELTTMAEYSQRDWDVAALLESPSPTVAASISNAVFSFIAYSMQGLVASIVVSFLALLFAVSALLHKRVGSESGVSILPTPQSTDRRCGFEAFETFLFNVVAGFLCCAVALYFSHLQNTYLRSKSASIWQFIQEDVRAGMQCARGAEGGISDTLAFLISGRGHDYSSDVALLGVLIVLLLMACMLIGVLRNRARKGQVLLLGYLHGRNADPVPPFGVPRDEHMEKLQRMQVWPMSYWSQNTLVAVLGLAIATVCWYRIGPFLLGALLVMVLIRSIAVMRKHVRNIGSKAH
jgi:hypothetical protein